MKKHNLVLPLLLAGLLTLSLVGCGETPSDNPPEHSYDTKPSEITSDRMSEKNWKAALGRSATNYSVSVLECAMMPRENEIDFPLGIEPIIYCRDGDKVFATLYPTTTNSEDPWQADTARLDYLYGEYEGTNLRLWQRENDEWIKYVDWSEEVTFGTIYSPAPFALYKDYYDSFVYDEEARAYVSTEEGLQKMNSTLNEIYAAALKQLGMSVSFSCLIHSITLRFENGYLSVLEMNETMTTMGFNVNMETSWVFFDWGKTVVETPENLPRDDAPTQDETPEAE